MERSLTIRKTTFSWFWLTFSFPILLESLNHYNYFFGYKNHCLRPLSLILLISFLGSFGTYIGGLFSLELISFIFGCYSNHQGVVAHWCNNQRQTLVNPCKRSVTVMLVQGVLPMAACPWQARPFMSFHILVFYFCIYFCISRKYDDSEISCLGLSDMKCLRMYYRGIRLVVNFSLPKVIYCKPLLFLSCLLI